MQTAKLMTNAHGEGECTQQKANAHRQECLCYSFVAQGDDWVDAHRAARRKITGGERDERENCGDADERDGIGCADSVEHLADEACEHKRAGKAKADSDE